MSPYLQAMFTNGMMESDQDVVTINGIDETTMETLINFSYSGMYAPGRCPLAPPFLVALCLLLSEIEGQQERGVKLIEANCRK